MTGSRKKEKGGYLSEKNGKKRENKDRNQGREEMVWLKVNAHELLSRSLKSLSKTTANI